MLPFAFKYITDYTSNIRILSIISTKKLRFPISPNFIYRKAQGLIFIYICNKYPHLPKAEKHFQNFALVMHHCQTSNPKLRKEVMDI